MARVLIGTSGWVYQGWRGRLYPPGLSQSRWLSYYATQFPTVEVNGTFYRLPSLDAVERWRESAPPGFVFAVKASRLITHYKRFRACEAELATYLERVRLLGDRLGPVLFQVPTGMPVDVPLLAAFLPLLPNGVRCAWEFRDASWYSAPVLDLLAARDMAVVAHDYAQTAPRWETTAGWAYLRFHGPGGWYQGSYTDEQLTTWAAAIARLQGLQTVYAYFNNDVDGHAVENARRLAELVLGAVSSAPGD